MHAGGDHGAPDAAIEPWKAVAATAESGLSLHPFGTRSGGIAFRGLKPPATSRRPIQDGEAILSILFILSENRVGRLQMLKGLIRGWWVKVLWPVA